MLEKLSKEEFNQLSFLFNPKSAVEILFSNLNNLTECEMNKFSSIRLSQLPYLNFSYMIAEDDKLSAQENFKLKRGAGSVFALGGRLNGKTMCLEETDIPLSMSLNKDTKHNVASFDGKHLSDICTKVYNILENHPFFILYQNKINLTKNTVLNRLGNVLTGINENIFSKAVGVAWEQHHTHVHYYEEYSNTTNTAANKKLMSKTELGRPIERVAGQTNFSRTSPAGKIYFAKEEKGFYRNRVINLPAFSRPTWTKEDEEDAIRQYGAKTDIGYRINIHGEVIEGDSSTFDMDLVRKCYNENKVINHTIVDKKTFPLFKSLIILADRPLGIKKVLLGADVGEGTSPTEIIIVYQINEMYKYAYNITLQALTTRQQIEIFKYVIDRLDINVVALDGTGGVGQSVYEALKEKYDPFRLVSVEYNGKIPIKIDKDNQGNIRRDLNGKPVYIEEYTKNWAVHELKELFYNQMIEIPIDGRLDMELTDSVTVQSGNREVYKSKGKIDHLFQAFQSFAIGRFKTEFVINVPRHTNFCKVPVHNNQGEF